VDRSIQQHSLLFILVSHIVYILETALLFDHIISLQRPIVFREHEWLKHGTCSGYPDERTFFETVLNLHNNIMFGQVLSQSGILPSKDSLDVRRG